MTNLNLKINSHKQDISYMLFYPEWFNSNLVMLFFSQNPLLMSSYLVTGKLNANNGKNKPLLTHLILDPRYVDIAGDW